ncbi:MAG TPA: methyltransferase [Caldimonas sp.]|nr:methyltransferase [Caldimonas sp.]
MASIASVTDGEAGPTIGRWRERWLQWRDRWLASAAFQRRAARLPLVRRIARRRAAQVFDLVAGFVYSQVLLACVRVRLFDLLAEQPLPLGTVAARTGLPPEAALRLLDAAVALRLVERRRGERFGLGVLGAPLVGNAAVAAMVEHHSLLYADLADPVALLHGQPRSTALAHHWPYAGATDPRSASREQVATYSALMAASQPLVADAVFEALDLDAHRCLLDVGGGDGSFIVAAAARAPRLRFLHFDLPAVVEHATYNFARHGLRDRVQVTSGSFVDDALPRGADIVTLLRVLHDHDDDRVKRLLGAVFDALPPDGTVLVAEPMAETPGAERMGHAYFGFYLLAMGRGRPRSAQRLRELLMDSGFVDVHLVTTAQPLQCQVLRAMRPSAKTLNAKT